MDAQENKLNFIFWRSERLIKEIQSQKNFMMNLLKDIKNINKIINVYNSPIKQVNKIIAFYNDTVDKYNKMMLKEYNKKLNENNIDIDIDIPILNTENNLSVKTPKGEIEQIYNKHSFNIVEKIIDTDEYIICDSVNKYIVNKEILLKNFKVAYCITLYAS